MLPRTVPADVKTMRDEVHRTAADPAIRECVALLRVAIAQIGGTMHESEASVAVLSEALSFLAAGLQRMRQVSSPAAGEPAQQQNLPASCSILAAKLDAAIIAIQFHDAMTQKLTHISENLRVLADLMTDAGRVHRPCAWQDLKQRTRARLSMDSERRVFDAILHGGPMEGTVRAAKNAEPPSAGTIDLF